MAHPFKLIATLLLLAPIVGCAFLQSLFGGGSGGQPPGPRQVMLVSTPATPIGSGVRVGSYSLPSGFQNFGIEEFTIEGEGGQAPGLGARPFTTPGIAASPDIWVIVYWGAPPGFNTLVVLTSESGRIGTWSYAGALANAASSQIDDLSRPALTYFPSTRTWFYAFRDDNTGTIVVDQIDVQPTGSADSRGVPTYRATNVSSVDTGIPTTGPAGLSYVGTQLVLAVLNNSGLVSVALSSDGRSFTAPVLATTTVAAAAAPNSTSIATDAGGPYLQKGLGGEVNLAAARIDAQGSVDINILSSTDGLAWNGSIFSVNNVASALPFPVEPSMAGPGSEIVVAYRVQSGLDTNITVNNVVASHRLDTNTNRAVGAAYGPGPGLVTRLSCGEPDLIARVGSSDTTIGAGGARTLSVRGVGDVTLICGAASQPGGCPSSTAIVVIERGSGPDYTLACWPS